MLWICNSRCHWPEARGSARLIGRTLCKTDQWERASSRLGYIVYTKCCVFFSMAPESEIQSGMFSGSEIPASIKTHPITA
ncbi:hypothetical protein AOLI_G00089300 [Acnodon oligacanthus]